MDLDIELSSEEDVSSIQVEDKVIPSYGDDLVLESDSTPDSLNVSSVIEQAPEGITPEIEAEIAKTQDVDTALKVTDGNIEASLAMSHTLDLRPDDMRQALDYQNNLGGTVEQSYNDLARAKKEKDFGEIRKVLFKKDEAGNYAYPVLRDRFANPSKAASSLDKAQALASLEDTIRRARQADEWVPMQFLRGLGSGSVDIAKTVVDTPSTLALTLGALADNNTKFINSPGALVTRGVRDLAFKELDMVADLFTDDSDSRETFINAMNNLGMKNSWVRSLERTSKLVAPIMAEGTIFDAWDKGDGTIDTTYKMAGNLTAQLGQTIPMLVGLLAGAATGYTGLALAGVGAKTAVDVTGEGLRQEGSDPGEVLTKAFGHAAFEMLGEYFSVKLFSRVLKRSLIELPTAAAKKAFINQSLKNAGIDTASEAASELFTALGQAGTNVVAEWDQKAVDKFMSNETVKQSVQATLLGGFMGGSISLGGSAVSILNYQRSIKKKEAVEKAKQLELDKQLEAIGIRDDVAPMFKESVLEMLESNDLSTKVYLTPDKLERFYQEDNGDLEDFLVEFGLKEEYETAKEEGRDLELDRAKWLVDLAGTEVSKNLSPDLTYDEGAVTQEENSEVDSVEMFIEKKRDSLEKTLEDATVIESRDVFYDSLKKKKKDGGAGLKAVEAKAMISLVDSWATIASEEYGISKKEWFDKYKPEVTRRDADEGTKGSISFNEESGKALIELTKKSDLTTIIHETGHLFIKDLESMGEVSEVAQEDYLTLIKEYNGDTEAMVRGFEGYIKKGVAPSNKLLSAFKTFAKWLSNVYDKMRNSGIETPNSEIVDLFNRRLAAEEDVEAANTVYNEIYSLKEILNEKEQKSLDEKLAKGKQKAKEDRVKVLTRDYLKAIGGKQAIEERALAETLKEPMYKAINDIVSFKGLPYSYYTMYDVDVDLLFRRHKGLVRKKGSDFAEAPTIEAIAADSGFADGEQFLNALIEAPTTKQAVTEKVSKAITAIEQDLKKEQYQEDINGEDDVHNIHTLAYKVAELEALERKINRKSKPSKAAAVKFQAEQIIGDKEVKAATDTYKFKREERKAAQRAFIEAKKGNIEKAIEFKQQELQNHAYAKEAINARRTLEKFKKEFGTRKLSKLLGKVDEPMVASIVAIGRQYGLLLDVKFDYLMEKYINDGSLLYLRNHDEALYSEIPSWVVSLIKGEAKDFSELSYFQLQDLVDSVKRIKAAGRDTVIGIKELEGLTNKEIKEEMITTADNLKDASTGGTPWADVKFKFNAMYAHLAQMPFIVERLDNYKFTKTGLLGAWKRLVSLGREAQAKSSEVTNRHLDNARPYLEHLRSAAKRVNNEVKLNPINVPVHPSLKLKKKHKWDGDLAIAVALYSGTKINREAVMKGYGLTDADINTILDVFTVEDMEAIQGIWNVLDDSFGEVNDTYYRHNNVSLNKEEAVGFKFKGVDFKGGYSPLTFDTAIDPDAEAQLGNLDAYEADMNRATLFRRTTTSNPGFTKKKQGKSSYAPKLSTAPLMSHFTTIGDYIGKADYNRLINKTVHDPSIVKMLNKKLGLASSQLFRDNFKYSQKKESKSILLNSVVSTVRMLSTINILGLNLKVAWKQRASLVSAATALGQDSTLAYKGWVKLAKGMMDVGLRGSLLGLKNTEIAQGIFDKSNVLEAREKRGIDREVKFFTDYFKGKEHLFVKIPGTNRRLTAGDLADISMALIHFSDRATVIPVWQGAYRSFLEQNTGTMSEEALDNAAIDYADTIVLETQPTTFDVDLSNFQRQEGWAKLVSSFTTWTLKSTNRVKSTFDRYNDGQISMYTLMSTLLMETAFSYTMAHMLGRVATLDFGDDKEEFMAELSADIALGIFAGVPGMRETVSIFRYGKDTIDLPIFKIFKDPIEAARTGVSFYNNEAEFDKWLIDMYKAVEPFTLLPASNLYKDYKKIEANINK